MPSVLFSVLTVNPSISPALSQLKMAFVQDILPKLAPDCAVFVGHGKYNELHDREEADDAYKLANEPKTLYFVEGKHNEWMFDEDPKLQGLCAAMNDFFKAHI